MKMTHPNPVVLVSGSKGGVGKSLVSMAVLDLIGPTSVLVETDTSNPDVAKAYETMNEVHPLNLDNRAGWMSLTDLCETNSSPIVINGAARSAEGLKFVAQFVETLRLLDRKLIILFVMSRARDSLELLADHREALPKNVAETWAVLNLFFGEADQFQRYANSNQKKELEATTGTLLFPDLADRVHDQLINERLTISAAEQKMNIANRVELSRWRDEAQAELAKAILPVKTNE